MKKRTKGDKAAAHELILFADNESSIYNQRVSIHKNLLRKIKKGQYSDTKAAKLWGYWFEAAAKSYAKQNATPADWSRIFSPSTRRLAARSYASREGKILKAASRGETSDYVYKNPRGRKVKGFRFEIHHRGSSRVETSRKLFATAERAVAAGRKIVAEFADVFRQSASVIAVPNNAKVRALAKRRKHWGGRTVSNVKKHRARRNPSSAYVLIASRKGKKLFFTGKNFSDRGSPKVFATQARAKTKERELLARFPVLENWAVFPVPYRPKM